MARQPQFDFAYEAMKDLPRSKLFPKAVFFNDLGLPKVFKNIDKYMFNGLSLVFKAYPSKNFVADQRVNIGTFNPTVRDEKKSTLDVSRFVPSLGVTYSTQDSMLHGRVNFFDGMVGGFFCHNVKDKYGVEISGQVLDEERYFGNSSFWLTLDDANVEFSLATNLDAKLSTTLALPNNFGSCGAEIFLNGRDKNAQSKFVATNGRHTGTVYYNFKEQEELIKKYGFGYLYKEKRGEGHIFTGIDFEFSNEQDSLPKANTKIGYNFDTDEFKSINVISYHPGMEGTVDSFPIIIKSVSDMNITDTISFSLSSKVDYVHDVYDFGVGINLVSI